MGETLSSCYSCFDENERDSTLMVFFSYADLVKLGRIPRSPQDRHLQTPYNKIHRDKSLLIYYSHEWLRGWSGAKDYNVVVPPLDTPKPHPDTANHDKLKLLIKAIDHMKKAYFPDIDEENIYVWIDYGCINQDVTACDELKMLDKIMGVCDLMVTTIYDDNWSREWYDKIQSTGITNWLQQYGSPAWNQGDHSYLKRAWCLVEMMYASNIPLVTSSAERLSMFRGVLRTCIEQNRRPHLLMGTNELERNMPPIVLPPTRSIFFRKNDPRKGKLTFESDRGLINELVDIISINNDEEGYIGERNAEGRKHGQGTYTSASGNVYKGEYQDGEMHGQGTYTFVDGDIYDGNWKDGQKHGQGVYTFADGEVYEGSFKNDKRHGQGIYRKIDGSIAHYGEWKDGKPVGKSYPRDEYGWITKRGHIYPSWKKRYFRLKMGVLEYYTDVSCLPDSLKGSVNIAGYNIDAATPLQIYISSSRNNSNNHEKNNGSEKDMYMRFENEIDRQMWLRALQQSI